MRAYGHSAVLPHERFGLHQIAPRDDPGNLLDDPQMGRRGQIPTPAPTLARGHSLARPRHSRVDCSQQRAYLMKLSFVRDHFASLIDESGDCDVTIDDVPNELAEFVLRDVDLTLLPDGQIYATAWDLDEEGQGTHTPLLSLLDFLASLIATDYEWRDEEESAEIIATFTRIVDFLNAALVSGEHQ